MALTIEKNKLLVKSGGLATGVDCCCEPPPPPPPPRTGPCCVDGVCSETTKAQCEEAGGVFYKLDEVCVAGFCDDPPLCETLECTEDEWDTAIVTIDLTIFGNFTSDTPANTTTCTNNFKALFQDKVEELNGTYTLPYDAVSGTYLHSSGTPGTTGYLEVSVSLDNPSVPTSSACPQKAVVSISLINLDENGAELYYAPFPPFLCVGPGQLFPLTGSKVAASTASNSGTAEFHIDMCDGESLSATTEMEGQYESEPSCRTFQCLNFEYSGTASVTLTNA